MRLGYGPVDAQLRLVQAAPAGRFRKPFHPSWCPSVSATIERSYVSWYGGDRVQTWRTPPAFFDLLHAEYGFTMDGAATNDDSLLARASTPDAPRSWAGERVFCNPPWSKIPPFVELAAEADLAVLLVPARTNCRWFHRALELGADVRYFKPKLKFVGAKHVSPVDCVLLVFSTPPGVTDGDPA